MSQISVTLSYPWHSSRIGELSRVGRRQTSTVPAPTAPALPAVRLRVTPATGLVLSIGGETWLYAWAEDADGRVVPGVDIGFASDNEPIVLAFEWFFDNRLDLVRCQILGDGETPGSANITVSAAGLPSVVVPLTAQPLFAWSAGKTVGLWMTDPVRTAEEAAIYTLLEFPSGLSGMLHEVEPEATSRYYFAPALVWATDNEGLVQRHAYQLFTSTRGVLGLDRQFSVAAWLAQFAKYPAAALNAAAPHSLIAHQILSIPNYTPRWGRIITPAEIRTIAQASKAAAPNLPVIVGGEPVRDGIGTGYSAADVDYAFPIYSYGKGPGVVKCKAWLNKMQAQSIAAGLGGVNGEFFCGMDIGDGGSGTPSSNPPGWKVKGIGQPATRWAMSPQEIATYGKVLGDHPAVLTILNDSYEARGEGRFFSKVEIKKALSDLSWTYGSAAGDPYAALNIPAGSVFRVGDRILLDTSGSGAPAGAPWVRFIDPGDGSPVYGPLLPGAADPVHAYTVDSALTEEGVVYVTCWVQRIDTGQTSTVEQTIVVELAAATLGGHYTDLAPLPTLAVPTPVRYSAHLSRTGYRVYYLADGSTHSAHQPALNTANTALFFIDPEGTPKFADVTFELDKVLVVNVRNAFTSAHGGRADSGIWWRPSPHELFTLSSGPSGKILRIDQRNLEATVEKDLFADARFRAAFGVGDRALSHLKINGADLGRIVFAATVVTHSTAVPLGVVVWEKTDALGAALDGLLFYRPPAPDAVILPDAVRLDYSGTALKVGLTGTPAEYARSWQTLELATGALGEWIRDEAGPMRDDAGDAQLWAADGEGVKSWAIYPPQSPGTLWYASPRVSGKGNEYMAGQTSAQAIWNGEVVVGLTLEYAGLVGPFERYSGDVWRTAWAAELEAKPYRLRPEVVRRGYLDLVPVNAPTVLGPDTWYFDGAWLYVGLPSGTIPRTDGPDELQAFDWRFGTEEILLFGWNGLAGRLTHHHHRRRTSDPRHRLNACQSFDGTRVSFTTNAGGGAERVYCVLTSPGDSPYV